MCNKVKIDYLGDKRELETRPKFFYNREDYRHGIC